jgi:uncharacterized membrane protein YhaH (DUF805 family)
MYYYFKVLKKYAVFEGRASRAEYWYFTLFNMIVVFILSFGETFFKIYLSGDVAPGSVNIYIYLSACHTDTQYSGYGASYA